MSEAIAFPDQQRFSAKVAANIRAEAARRGVQQQQLAQQLGLSQSGVSNRYSGKTPWSLDEIEAVARVLRTTTSMLCAIRDSNPEPAGLESMGTLISLDAWRSRRAERTALVATTRAAVSA